MEYKKDQNNDSGGDGNNSFKSFIYGIKESGLKAIRRLTDSYSSNRGYTTMNTISSALQNAKMPNGVEDLGVVKDLTGVVINENGRTVVDGTNDITVLEVFETHRKKDGNNNQNPTPIKDDKTYANHTIEGHTMILRPKSFGQMTPNQELVLDLVKIFYDSAIAYQKGITSILQDSNPQFAVKLEDITKQIYSALERTHNHTSIDEYKKISDNLDKLERLAPYKIEQLKKLVEDIKLNGISGELLEMKMVDDVPTLSYLGKRQDTSEAVETVNQYIALIHKEASGLKSTVSGLESTAKSLEEERDKAVQEKNFLYEQNISLNSEKIALEERTNKLTTDLSELHDKAGKGAIYSLPELTIAQSDGSSSTREQIKSVYGSPGDKYTQILEFTNKDLEKELTLSINSNNLLQGQRKAAYNKLAAMRSVVSVLEDRVKDLTNRNTELAKKKGTSDEENSLLKKQIQGFEAYKVLADGKIQEQTDKIVEAVGTITNLKDIKQDLEERLEETARMLKERTDELEGAKIINVDITSKYQAIEAEYLEVDNQRILLESQLKGVRPQLEYKQGEVKELSGQVSDYERQRVADKALIESLKGQNQTLKIERDNAVESRDNAKENYDKEIIKLGTRLTEAINKRLQIDSDLKRLEKK